MAVQKLCFDLQLVFRPILKTQIERARLYRVFAIGKQGVRHPSRLDQRVRQFVVFSRGDVVAEDAIEPQVGHDRSFVGHGYERNMVEFSVASPPELAPAAGGAKARNRTSL